MKKLFFCNSKLLLLTAITFLIFCRCKENNVDPALQDSDSQFTGDKVDVGLYIDHGVWDGTENTVTNMLKGVKCSYNIITRDSILNANLNRYSIILIPGGDMWEYVSYLAPAGMKKIKDFVRNGGGYIGICGGAYFGTNKITWRGWAGEPRINISITGLNLGPVDSDGPIEDFAPSYKDIKCKVNIAGKDHAISLDVPGTVEIYYDHGPKFLVNDTSITTIGKTFNGDKTTLIAFQCGKGNVFLTGLHPEMDGTHISWALIKNAVKWCSNK